MQKTAIKKAKCSICKSKFTAWNSMVSVCSPACALKKVDADKKKKKALLKKQQDAYFKRKKEELVTTNQLKKRAERAVNAYVNLRDYKKPCVSCGKPNIPGHVRHASHYLSVGSCSSLRYNLHNINSSCYSCNSSKSGNATEYRIALVKMKGEELVQWLESQPKPKTYEREYLIRLAKVFNRRCRLIKKRRDKQYNSI